MRFSRTDRVRSESDGRRDGSHMFGDKVCGLLQALERDLGNGFERAALLSESLARKAGLIGRLHLVSSPNFLQSWAQLLDVTRY